MKSWPIKDAKAKFSEFLEVMARPSLKESLLSNRGRGELAIPPREAARRRKISETK